MKPRVVKAHPKPPVPCVYIGRPSMWGDPFVIGPDGDRTAVIDKYITYLLANPGLLRHLDELRGRNLGCYCAPMPCHGDVLLLLANTTIPVTAYKNLGALERLDLTRMLTETLMRDSDA